MRAWSKGLRIKRHVHTSDGECSSLKASRLKTQEELMPQFLSKSRERLMSALPSQAGGVLSHLQKSQSFHSTQVFDYLDEAHPL